MKILDDDSGGHGDMPGRVGRMPRGRLSRAIARFMPGSLQEWASVVLVFVTLAVAVWSIEQAKWIQPQPSLVLALGLAVLACLFLVKSRIPDWATYFLMVVLGLAVTVWQSTGLFIPTEDESAFQSWWRVVSSGQPNEGTVYFAMFLLFVTWLIGFISTWFILRRRNVWVAVFLGTVTILVNLSNLPRAQYYLYPFYLLAAVVLIGQVNLTRYDDWFRKQGIKYPYRGIRYFVAVVLCISVLTVGTAWFVPEPPVERIGLVAMAGAPLLGTNAVEYWFNIFAAVRSKWSLIESSEQETLSFGDPVGGGGRILFVVTSDRSGYWRTRRYDTYHSWGWTSSITSDRTLNPGAMASEVEELAERNVLTYTVESRLNTDVLLTNGEFVSADIPVLLQIWSAGETMTGQPATDEADRIEDGGGDIIAVVSPRLLRPYQRYTVVATTTSVTPGELSQAGEDYPPWVTDYYLQLPDNLPERVKLLSQELTEAVEIPYARQYVLTPGLQNGYEKERAIMLSKTQRVETPYDKVVAIKAFLDRFEYDLAAEAPPEGVDGVDWFLSDDQQKGTCVNFASAMVVMLRSVGVPARLCVGYLRGELDEDTGNFIIRSRNYHAWAEVYFPGYGWIEFETTPISGGEGVIAGAGDILAVGEEAASPSLPFWMQPPESVEVGDVPESGTDSVSTRQSGLNWYVYFAIIGTALLLVFIIVIIARLVLERWIERLKRVGSAFEAYNRMCFLASWGKLGPMVQETPLEYSARLALALPTEAVEINDVAQAYVDVQYGPREELEEVRQARLQKSWVRLCPFLVRSLLRLRWRSR